MRRIIIAALCAVVLVATVIAILFATGVFKAAESAPDEPKETAQQQSDAHKEEAVEATGSSGTVDSAGTPEESTDTPAPSAHDGTETASSEPAPDRAEVAVYDKLLVLYNDLGAFDQRISEAAQRFNENYLSPDYDTRIRYATEADELLTDIYSSYDDLYSTTVSPQSPNFSAYEALEICYEDCVQRISVISEAWNISLSCDDPSAYRDEILAPVMRDNVNGANRYYTEFQETYPSAEPVAP